MITLDDIEDMTDLSREEIAAVAEHEHLPEFNAAVLGDYTMHLHHGAARVQQMICDDIREALHRDDLGHARELYAVLHHFIAEHPEAARGAE
jgi:S-ribosylhomocysteine lyase LuxS involved in autoinducer biosynthesis